MQLGTKWAIKPTPTGVLVPMLKKHPTAFDSAPSCMVDLKANSSETLGLMEGIWIFERLLMTLLRQSETHGAAGRREEGKRGKEKSLMRK